MKKCLQKEIKKHELRDKELEYIKYHKKRIKYNIKLVFKLVNKIEKKEVKLMDIGPHFQTHVMSKCIDENIEINTMGWKDEKLVKNEDFNRHFKFDLNNAIDRSLWPEIERHDVVIMSEVIEHLYTSPAIVLRFLKNFIEKRGYFVLQTPNAVDATKRLKMLFGTHPYERISEDQSNPGHFREYTKGELREYVEQAGLEVENIAYCDYWPQRGIRRLMELVIPSFQRGITLIARRP